MENAEEIKRVLQEMKDGIRKAMAQKMKPEAPAEELAVEEEGEALPEEGESDVSELDIEKLKELLDSVK